MDIAISVIITILMMIEMKMKMMMMILVIPVILVIASHLDLDLDLLSESRFEDWEVEPMAIQGWIYIYIFYLVCFLLEVVDWNWNRNWSGLVWSALVWWQWLRRLITTASDPSASNDLINMDCSQIERQTRGEGRPNFQLLTLPFTNYQLYQTQNWRQIYVFLIFTLFFHHTSFNLSTGPSIQNVQHPTSTVTHFFPFTFFYFHFYFDILYPFHKMIS